MDFYDILREASKNKEKAEKELPGNKRFNLNFRPKKEAPRPKVDRAAIAARLKKKEEEERIQAAIDEEKRREVLALRAEQEAQKSAARKRRVSSSSSSHAPNSSREEKAKKPKERHQERQPREEDSPPRKEKVKKERVVEPKKEKYEDYLFKKRHAEEEAKSRNEKLMKDNKMKSFSFKELMDIAAANAGVPKPGTADQGKTGEKCQPNVKLKGKDRPAKRADVLEKKIPAVKHPGSSSSEEQRNSQERSMKSKDKSTHRKPVHDDKNRTAPNKLRELLTSDKKSRLEPRLNGQNSEGSAMKKSHVDGYYSSRPAKGKSTCFPNTKSANSPKALSEEESNLPRKEGSSVETDAVKSKRSSDDGKEKRRTEDRSGSRELQNGRPSHQPAKRNGEMLDSDQRNKRKPETTKGRKEGNSSHHPVKRKGGWLDPDGKPAGNAQRSGESKNDRPSHHPAKRKGGWLDPDDGPPTRSGSSDDRRNVRPSDRPVKKKGWLDPENGHERQNERPSHHPVKRKGGWLDPPERSLSDDDTPRQVNGNANGNAKKIAKSTKERPVPNGVSRDHPKQKKGGWLDPVQKGPTQVERTLSPSKGDKIRASSSSPVPKARPSGGSKVGRAEEPVKERKRGWLEPDVAPVQQRGGWLGPVREPSNSRPGGWLGPVREPSLHARGGRLLSSDEEEEDSDLDGFIDDDPVEGETDVSSYIQEIFGYDKSKFKYESDYSLRNMESSYSQMMKEEARSARIAQQEDAEELRKERELEKKLAAKKRRR